MKHIIEKRGSLTIFMNVPDDYISPKYTKKVVTNNKSKVAGKILINGNPYK